MGKASRRVGGWAPAEGYTPYPGGRPRHPPPNQRRGPVNWVGHPTAPFGPSTPSWEESGSESGPTWSGDGPGAPIRPPHHRQANQGPHRPCKGRHKAPRVRSPTRDVRPFRVRAPDRGTRCPSVRAPVRRARGPSVRAPGRRIRGSSIRAPVRRARCSSVRAPIRRARCSSARAPIRRARCPLVRAPGRRARCPSIRVLLRRARCSFIRAPIRRARCSSIRAPGRRSRCSSIRALGRRARCSFIRAPIRRVRGSSMRAPIRRARCPSVRAPIRRARRPFGTRVRATPGCGSTERRAQRFGGLGVGQRQLGEQRWLDGLPLPPRHPHAAERQASASLHRRRWRCWGHEWHSRVRGFTSDRTRTGCRLCPGRPVPLGLACSGRHPNRTAIAILVQQSAAAATARDDSAGLPKCSPGPGKTPGATLLLPVNAICCKILPILVHAECCCCPFFFMTSTIFILFIKIHHKQHINYRLQESKLLMMKLLWRGKKDRHLQLPYSMVKANKSN